MNMAISYRTIDYWWCYEFDHSVKIGKEEQDLIKLRVAWQLWGDGDLEDETRVWELYKAHKGAMKIIRKIENELSEKQETRFKEDENDPSLACDLEMLKCINGMNLLNEQDKKVLSRITIRNGTKYYSLQFSGNIIGRTELGWYNRYVNLNTRNTKNDDSLDYVYMLIKLGISDMKDKIKGMIWVNIEVEGYNTLMDIEEKVWNYPYFGCEEDS
jgi:hypothetical protein